jgi:hypothetical protein
MIAKAAAGCVLSLAESHKRSYGTLVVYRRANWTERRNGKQVSYECGLRQSERATVNHAHPL